MEIELVMLVYLLIVLPISFFFIFLFPFLSPFSSPFLYLFVLEFYYFLLLVLQEISSQTWNTKNHKIFTYLVIFLLFPTNLEISGSILILFSDSSKILIAFTHSFLLVLISSGSFNNSFNFFTSLVNWNDSN